MSSLMTRGTFRDDGYQDGKAGLPPNPPDEKILAKEYMEGFREGKRDNK